MKTSNLAFALLFFVLSCQDEIRISEQSKDINPSGNKKYSNSAARQRQNVVSPFQYCSGTPIGGAAGYSGIVTSGNKTLQISGQTPTQLGVALKALIDNAVNNDIIFIPLCTIEVPQPLEITKSITLAGDRGHNSSEGALIRSTDATERTFIKILANGVRITGLRLEGNSSETFQDTGIGLDDSNLNIKSVEVDNCELFQWMQGVSIHHTYTVDFKDANYQMKVHHSDIHHNATPGNGYGVVVGNAYVKIYANIFDNNRHEIAGTGAIKSGYEAYCNTILESATGVANFDMHFGPESKAGGFMKIHHNDFKDLNCQGNIFIVGQPNVICLITNNKFATGNIYTPVDNCPVPGSVAIQNRPENPALTTAYGNVIAVNNIYNSSYLGWYVRENWVKTRTDNFIRIPSTNDLLSSNLNPTIIAPGVWISSQQQELDYYFGDFDGNNSTDIFKADGQEWSYLPLESGYQDNWVNIATSGYKLGTISLVASTTDVYKITPTMILGNFDSDDETDFLAQGSGVFIVSYGGNPWAPTLSSGMLVDQYLFGRFNRGGFNLGITDVFKVDAGTGHWWIGYDINTWIDVNNVTGAIPINSSAVGDFNGDGHADVLNRYSSQWRYSSNAVSSWIYLPVSTVDDDAWVVANFNADLADTYKTSDIIELHGSTWKVALSGTVNWKPLTEQYFPATSFAYGNLR